ncbi:MAG: tryptophan synthase subunit alpha [Candidatus Promineifilaceae bacterium]
MMTEQISSGRRDSGLGRIASAFSRALSTQSAALMPYFTLGYPDPETSLDVIEAIAPYSDLIELGVPFSDPIADGPTIQRSTQQAIEAGVTTTVCLEMVRELRSRDVRVPLLLMGYYNPILAYGEERYTVDLADAGADGLIVPDIPPEEADNLRIRSLESGLALINFVAPTSNEERVKMIISKASGFIYMVSVTGVTGARRRLSTELSDFVSDIKAQTDLPVAVGFGISSASQAASIGEFADGVIVGSALINAVDEAEDKPAAGKTFVSQLRKALEL